jgi:serine/threonine protein kinase
MTSFGCYTIEREIGRGRTCIVFCAEHTLLHRRCALKMLVAGHNATREDRARLWKEARFQIAANHPNIPQVHEVGEFRELLFIVMELCEGGSLADRLARGTLEPRAVADLGQTLASTLGHLHQRGVYHRNLCPEHVLFTADGQPRLIGFLRAACFEPASGPCIPALDLAALGALLFQALVGQPPEGTDLRPLAETRPDVPYELVRILSRCLEPGEGRGYTSMEEVALDLRTFLTPAPGGHPA